MKSVYVLGLFFVSSSALLFNPVLAEEMNFEMDWIVEGQIDAQEISSKAEAETTGEEKKKNAETASPPSSSSSPPSSPPSSSSSAKLIEDEKPVKPIYDKFVTDNQYSIGDYKITIESEEGQMLNGMIIEQQELQKESFKHKIRYYDRFSDGYVEVAEALLDPIGDIKYLIQGRSLDHNPNSNLELFVIERGYSLDDLEAIPNDIFSPKEFTLGRQLMEEFQATGEGGVDLRQYAINHLHMDKKQIQEKMIESFSKQSSQVFTDIMSGNTLQSELQLEPKVSASAPLRESQSIFDNFKFGQPKFENTRHVRDSLQRNDSIEMLQPTKDAESNMWLILIPISVGLAIFGYLTKRMLCQCPIEEPPLIVTRPQTNYKELTQEMLNNSLRLYNSDKQKEAHEALSRAIRYYYSQYLKIFKDVTNFELIDFMKKENSSDYQKARNWLLLCGSVEFAKHPTDDTDFKDALSEFSKKIIS